jgi:choline dehydrogenase-like flavoprotein
MIDDARHTPDGSALECDLCIIGGGPAGISIARALRDTALRIVLLESGGTHETPAEFDLNRGFPSAPGQHEPLEENRRRVWGGSTVAWGGRAVPFDPIDFERRDWVPHSGWPIRATDLDPYYAEAGKLYDAGEPLFTVQETFPGRAAEMIAGFDGDEVVTNRLERWGPPVHFGRAYGPDLRRARNVSVLHHATCTRLRSENGARVIEAEFACGISPRRAVVRARRFVLAGGVMENARLLLASNEGAPGGLGNGHDNVGRFYLTHLYGCFARARLRDIGPGFFYEFERDATGVYCRRRFWITPEAQRRRRMMNAVAFFFRPPILDVSNATGLLAATQLAKFSLSTLRRLGPARGLRELHRSRAELGTYLRRALGDMRSITPELWQIVRQRFLARRRLPFVLPPRRAQDFWLFFQTEHTPSRESRVRLHPERDALGMPRLEAGLRFGDGDRHTIVELHRALRERFAASGTGELIYDEAALEHWVDERLANYNSNAFQMGTTRMAADPREGVVDAHCRVHGVENLFVAGASVYPTSGHANPGFMLIALALRLADHLRHH